MRAKEVNYYDMVKIRESVLIDRPVEDVWRFITDISNGPEWDKDVIEWRQTSTGPLGVGTTLSAVHRRLTYSESVAEYEPNQKFSLQITSGPAKGTIGTLSVVDTGGKTKLTESSDYRFSGFYKLVGPFLTRTARKETASRVGNVKRILESEAPSKAAAHS